MAQHKTLRPTNSRREKPAEAHALPAVTLVISVADVNVILTLLHTAGDTGLYSRFTAAIKTVTKP